MQQANAQSSSVGKAERAQLPPPGRYSSPLSNEGKGLLAVEWLSG